MSQTSISVQAHRSTSISTSKSRSIVSVEKRTIARRYSDINIMMLEGHKAVAPE